MVLIRGLILGVCVGGAGLHGAGVNAGLHGAGCCARRRGLRLREPCGRDWLAQGSFFLFFTTLGLELSDAKVYEP